MNEQPFTYGFRVVGGPHEPRRLVTWRKAFAAHCVGDVDTHEAYLSAWTYGPELVAHMKATGGVAGYAGPTWADWIPIDIDGAGPDPWPTRWTGRGACWRGWNRKGRAWKCCRVGSAGARAFMCSCPMLGYVTHDRGHASMQRRGPSWRVSGTRAGAGRTWRSTTRCAFSARRTRGMRKPDCSKFRFVRMNS